ncbi:MAG: outer membrane beta-barrel protein [Pseudaminobacter sp.]|nr:outer membrane beta-barrel protein [Pseudaminobacter sp.]
MPPVRPKKRSSPTQWAARGLLTTAAGAALLCASSLHAQEVGGLRGQVSETDINAFLLPRNQPSSGERRAAPTTTGAIPEPVYIPASPGATPDDASADPAGASLFEMPGEDMFAGEQPTSAGPPTTARRRAEEARQRSLPAEPEDAVEDAQRETDEATTGTVRVEAIGSDEDALDAGAARVEAIEGLDRDPDDDPFAATGIRVGSFVLRPTIEQGVTATSNADSSAGGSSAVLSETTLRLNAVSDWGRHSAALDAYGNFRKTISGDEVEEIRGGFDSFLELDLRDDIRARAEVGYAAGPESASSPVVIEGTVSQPLRQILNASLGLEKDAGKARFGITGGIERDIYGDADLSAGGVLSQKDRNSTLAIVSLRGGYEISPALTPFLETETGRRFYDEEFDAGGFERSSNRLAARAGVELDISEKLTGEFSAGWIREDFDDDRLESISGPTLNADLFWSPERGTRVNLAAATTVEGTTTAGESGSILHAGRLSVEREIRANLTANAAAGVSYRDYTGSDGHDLTLSAEAGTTWWLNRQAGLTGRLRHETLKSNLPGRDYEANSVFLGVKLQR